MDTAIKGIVDKIILIFKLINPIKNIKLIKICKYLILILVKVLISLLIFVVATGCF